MTTTRWKWTAGGLVLALGGLAAVAGVPSGSCQADHKAAQQPLIDIPAVPTVAASPIAPVIGRAAYSQPVDSPPAPTAPAVPTAPEIPPPPAVSTPAELPVPVPSSPVPAAEKKPQPKEDKVYELKVPVVEPVKPTAADTPSKPAPVVTPEPKPEPKPLIPAPEAKPEPQPVAAFEPVPAAPIKEVKEPELPKPVEARPAPKPAAEKPEPKPAAGTPDPLLATPPAPTPGLVEKKLKVMLHMGEDRPHFEVRDGDEIYLKVVCDKVDVKSPSDQGDAMSTMRATGNVSYITPGGKGTCEELTVIPGTGQVVVSGQVSFKYNWGNIQTVVSGDKMMFRLGATPASTPDAFQASHQQMR